MGKTPNKIKPEDHERVRIKPDVYIATTLASINANIADIKDILSKKSPIAIKAEEIERIEKEHETFRNILDVLKNVQDSLATSPVATFPHYNTEEKAIQVSTPVKPAGPDFLSDPVIGTPGYQSEDIYTALGRKSTKITLINDGTENLFIITSPDSKRWSTETPVFVGEAKSFYDVWEMRLRCPVSGNVQNRSGGVYRLTEYETWLSYNTPILPVIELFFDGYESPTLKFDSSIVGLGTVARSMDTALNGDFSLKLVTGAVINDSNLVQYSNTSFHDTKKIGVEISFAAPSLGGFTVLFQVLYFPGDGTFYTASISWNIGTSTVQILTPNGFQNLAMNVSFAGGIHDWGTMKLVVDLSTKKYTWLRFLGREFDLSGMDLSIGASASARLLEFQLILRTDVNLANTLYLDDFRFTDNEGVTIS